MKEPRNETDVKLIAREDIEKSLPVYHQYLYPFKFGELWDYAKEFYEDQFEVNESEITRFKEKMEKTFSHDNDPWDQALVVYKSLNPE